MTRRPADGLCRQAGDHRGARPLLPRDHPDGVARHEDVFEGTGTELVDFVFEQHRKADATSHQLADVLMDVQGDRATSESDVTACIRSEGHDITVRGRYSDHWSPRSGRWGIDERRYRHDIVQVSPASGL